jgi:AraC-like DNA-binding protein
MGRSRYLGAAFVALAGYADPAFSVRHVAARVRLAPRYVQNLLVETGASFTERVLELRLQKARRMLADRSHDRMKVGDIAYACGFGEVPYFNRRFRRRFGATPTEYRKENAGHS